MNTAHCFCSKSAWSSFGLCAALAVFTPLLAHGQSDPIVGTWKVSPAESICEPAPYPFTQWTSSIEKAPEGYLHVGSGVGIDGKPRHLEVLWRADGKQTLSVGASPQKTFTWKRINERVFDYTRSSPSEMSTFRSVISPDGKMRTNFAVIRDNRGATIRSCMEVMYKQ